ncbi:DUF4468 domain-containing protein [Chitinophaga sp. LS1]|uniref:DUF4468 domain-containing protein n=1 Tax=Chitinophaga sp. LS1 TaxID=3051176 RepID=UPI002AAC0AD8|nr:DUF4468 domain-containing protein [Chitinophaga sp. LS1]WPV65959.1 DUF4468 domain-containing protein [Chitinophaga sp. LS1]
MKGFLFLILFTPILVHAQDSLLYNIFPIHNGKIRYEKIIHVDSVSKNDIYTRIKEWALENYNSQKATKQEDDKDAGFLVYTGYFEKPFEGKMKRTSIIDDRQVWNTIKFYVKEGRVKIIIDDIRIRSKVYAANVFTSLSSNIGDAWYIEKYESYYKDKNTSWVEQNKVYFNSLNKDFYNTLSNIASWLTTKKISESTF